MRLLMSGDSQNAEGSQMSAVISVNMKCFTSFPTFEQTTKFDHISSSWKPSKIRLTREPDITLVSLSLRYRSLVEISSKLQKARDWGVEQCQLPSSLRSYNSSRFKGNCNLPNLLT